MTDAMQEIKEKVQSLKRIVLAATFGEPHSFGINEEERDWLLGTITALLAEVEKVNQLCQRQATGLADICAKHDQAQDDLAALRRENAMMKSQIEDERALADGKYQALRKERDGLIAVKEKAQDVIDWYFNPDDDDRLGSDILRPLEDAIKALAAKKEG